MKILVVYESFFGNTEIIARLVAETLGRIPLKKASAAKPEDLQGVEALIVGSPTRAFSYTPGIRNFLKIIPANSLNGVKIAAFDTRVDERDIRSGLLRFLIKLFGYAAEPLTKRLVKKGGIAAVLPAGFLVQATEGPLKENELQRAKEWTQELLNNLKS